MDDSLVQELTAQLSHAMPPGEAIVQFRVVEEGDIEPDARPYHIDPIAANRAGFLRLGLLCLQAAYAPYAANSRDVSDAIVVDSAELFGEHHPVVRFERSEDLKRLGPEPVDIETAKGCSWWIVGLWLLAGLFWYFAC